MWNPDQTYLAEQVRREELYAEAQLYAELERAAQANPTQPRLIVQLGQLLARLGAQLRAKAQTSPGAAE